MSNSVKTHNQESQISSGPLYTKIIKNSIVFVEPREG